MTPPRSDPDATPALALPRAIWVLGCVSLLMDISSEMVRSLLPLFLVGALGVSVAVVGLIEGIAESTALVVKVFSGVLSDHFRRRKGLAVLGYALGALTKPAFALAQGAGLVVAARFVDRIGKGIRGAGRRADRQPRQPARARDHGAAGRPEPRARHHGADGHARAGHGRLRAAHRALRGRPGRQRHDRWR
jgi:hypothetical protein